MSRTLTPTIIKKETGSTVDLLWNRPDVWLNQPTYSDGSEYKTNLLIRVTERGENYIAFSADAGAGGDYEVDWGDGTTDTYPSSQATHQYNYNDLSSDTELPNGDRQAMITITTPEGSGYGVSVLSIGEKHPSINKTDYWTVPIMEINIADSDMSSLDINKDPYYPYLDNFYSPFNTFPDSTVTNLFQGLDIKNIQELDVNGTTDLQETFKDCTKLVHVKLKNTDNIENLTATFNNAKSLVLVENSGFPIISVLDMTFRDAESLIMLPLDISAGTYLAETFSNTVFKSLHTIDMSADIDTASWNPFGSAEFYNLEHIRLRNMNATLDDISVKNSNLDRDALVTLFEDLYDRTDESEGTIDIKGSEGVSDLTQTDRDIAINKNWSITD